jgi:hypothetical protein
LPCAGKEHCGFIFNAAMCLALLNAIEDTLPRRELFNSLCCVELKKIRITAAQMALVKLRF